MALLLLVTKISRAAEVPTTNRSTTKKPTSTLIRKKSTDEKEKLRTTKVTISKTNEVRKPATTVKSSTNEKTTPRTTTSKTATTKITNNRTQTKINSTGAPSKTTTRVSASQPQQQRLTKVSKSSTASPTATTPRQQPLRAKHTPEIKEAVRRNATAKSSPSAAVISHKPNPVLDTHSNVTVASPPPRRKSEVKEENYETEPETNPKETKLNRKGSRVLAPDEIVVLKRESAKKRIEEQIRRDSVVQLAPNGAALPLKEPVAFEVPFTERQKTAKERNRPEKPEELQKKRERSSSRVRQAREAKKEDEDINYSDDFDSYESDFETGSSRKSSTHGSSSNPSDEEEGETNEEEDDDEDEDCSSSKETSEEEEDSHESENYDEEQENSKNLDTEEDEESEITQDPITVLQRDKERKLDSGHYELNSRRHPKLGEVSNQSTQHLTDSFENFSLNTSDQLDSGISAYGGPSTLTNFSNSNNSNKGNFQIFYGGYKDFLRNPIHNKRGADLMAKIQLDTLEFKLFDMKPISYDVFMQSFGKLNSCQIATQTQDNLMNVKQQTESWESRSMWTQHPPQYDWEMVKQLTHPLKAPHGGGVLSQNCCGELEDENDPKLPCNDELENSLEALKLWENQKSQRKLQNHGRVIRKPIDYERLNSFLLKSSMVINQILGSSGSKTSNEDLPKHLGHLERLVDTSYELQANFLNTLRVVKIFSNAKYNLVITVHESLPETDVYKSDFSQLLMVWCVNVNDKPSRLLSTWSQVSRVEISNDCPDIVVAALRDGSVALWDLRETYSFCSKLDGYLTHFAATQSIVPSSAGVQGRGEILMDNGSCLDVRSFQTPTNNWALAKGTQTKSQFVSLHDSGLLTVWTLVDTSEMSFNPLEMKVNEKQKHYSKLQQKFGYSSPWARVKLIQSSVAYLKDYVETKNLQSLSRFDKTKALFQKNIYSDEALKELNENSGAEMGSQGLRFTSIECGTENIFICTNRNFVLMCSKTLKPERFRRIILHESRLLFPTALKVLSNENFVAVGLSNGGVMILNCALNKQTPKTPKTACKTPGTPFPGQPNDRNPQGDFDNLTGKSCAIQNIVLNSQKSYDSMDFTSSSNDVEFRPDTAAFVALIDTNRKPFELRIYDQQVILAGSVLRRNLIQALELSSDGWRLFALSNGHVRIYDFYLEQEIVQGEGQEEQKACGVTVDIGCARTNQHEMNLITLERESKVRVYVLKK
ncbi:uncharacterized protein LOC133326897 [Musca vetustissima]|uniref:uncharacterized protein LOC133326897 n=1 Tax=Musca vetustissima TaxID=27455 RepID=UPI002AB7A461|nr:uncharacterized protein LOC133326897 [Musca vetustissima]